MSRVVGGVDEGNGVAWVQAGDGYELALRGERVVCRNAAGRVLRSVPAKLRDGDVVERLRNLADWLARHERECADTVEGWMLRSLPVPASVPPAVWSDPAWRTPLRDAVVVPAGSDGALEEGGAGLLRSADPERGLGVVGLDGETRRLDAQAFALPHPVLLPELEDWRDFAAELGVEQGLPQLHREVWAQRADLDGAANEVRDFAGGRFERRQHALSRCRTLGVPVSGGFAVARVWERGRLVEARYWIGAEHPEEETWTGELVWVDAAGRTLPLAAVGPVAWSEGHRFASAIYAGRAAERDEEAE
jgi:Domain of unknown function (DUF4132)